MWKFLLFFNCLLLSSCLVGPDYKEPEVQSSAHWLNKSPLIQESSFQEDLWWNSFHDPILVALIQQGYYSNLSVQSAGVRVLQARAQLAQAVGELYPQQQALVGNYTYNRIGGGSLQSLLPSDFLTALAGFSASWELDFWGKYRRAIQANDAAFLGSLAAYDYALVTLTSDVALSYIKIRTTEAKIKVTKANIAVQSMGLRIAKSRFRNGQTSLVDVEQAQTELSQTQAMLPTLMSNLQIQKDVMAVLLGTVPNVMDGLLEKSYGIPKAPMHVAVGIPLETLARRPDIYEARMEAVKQSATIGQIKASLYPSLSLTGTFAFASNNIGTSNIGDIFNWGNRTITAGPGFTWSVLNYGQITNAVRAQDALFQQALLKYENLVLKAQQEVQDSISSFVGANQSVQFLTKANTSATKSLKLALVRYKEGETDFTPVLNAEQQLLQVQMSLVNAQGDIPQSLVMLYRGLGGGWKIRANNDVVSEEVKRAMAQRTNWGSLLKPQNHQAPLAKKQLYLPKW